MTLRLEKSGKLARLLIDRLDKRNAFNQEMWDIFPDLLADAMEDDAIRVLMLQASQKDSSFCAGADIKEFAEGTPDPEWRRHNQASINRVQFELARAPKPTIAVIDGDCIGGGCGLALACDFRIAGPKARLGITPAKLGLVYPLHDTKLLVDAVGPSHAKRLLFSGALIDAEEALAIGLITQLTDDPHKEAAQFAEQLCAVSRDSQTWAKTTVRRILDGQAQDDDESLELFAKAFDGDDFAEGVDAFLNKRKPKFK